VFKEKPEGIESTRGDRVFIRAKHSIKYNGLLPRQKALKTRRLDLALKASVFSRRKSPTTRRYE
jgi:hypothetical protein